MVELDGTPHGFDARIEHDRRRTEWLLAHGIRVVRFANRDVFEDADRVADAIYLAASAPLPSRY